MSVLNSMFKRQSLIDQNKLWMYDPFFLCSEVDSFLAVIFIPSFKGRIQNPLQLMEVFPLGFGQDPDVNEQAETH